MFENYTNLSKEVYIIALSKLVASLGAFIWPLFVIILRSKVMMDEASITTLMSISVFVSIGASILGGFLSDKIGRKKIIVIFEFLGMLSYLLIIIFPVGMITAILLIIGMMFFGISWPAHDALIANVTKTEERESAYSLGYMATNLGIIIGPSIGGLLIRNHFDLFIAIDVATTFLGWFLLVKLIKEPNVDSEKENMLEESTDKSVLKIVKERPVIFFYGLLLMFTSIIYGQLDFTLPLYVESLFDDFEGFFALNYGLNGLVVLLFTPLLTVLLKKLTAMQKVGIGILLYSLTMFMYSVIDFKIGFFLVMFLFTIGEVIIVIGSGPVMSKLVPANMMARASSLIGIFYTIGHLIAINIPGYLIANDYSFRFVWLSIGFISIFAILYHIYFTKKYSNLLNYVDDFDANRK